MNSTLKHSKVMNNSQKSDTKVIIPTKITKTQKLLLIPKEVINTPETAENTTESANSVMKHPLKHPKMINEGKKLFIMPKNMNCHLPLLTQQDKPFASWRDTKSQHFNQSDFFFGAPKPLQPFLIFLEKTTPQTFF